MLLSGSDNEIVCTDITLGEARQIPPIPSFFQTDRVFRLAKSGCGLEFTWQLREQVLDTPFHKRYDSGDMTEWLEPYLEQSPAQKLQFLAARVHDRILGLLTWQAVAWNESVWLLDVRTHPDFRRSGIGRTLVERLKQYTRQIEARGITVETQINNYPAISFYRELGFDVAGFHDHMYTNGDLTTQDVAVFLFWEAS